MDVPVEALARAITDFESYPKFLPEVVAAERVKGTPDTTPRVVFELEIVKRFRYTLEFAVNGQKEISWRLVDSDFFKTNQGRWVLKPEGDGKTHVTYDVEVNFGFLVPGWITKKLTEVNLPKMFDSFEGHARTLAAGRSGKKGK